jgi:hypothetical protein
MAIKIGKISRSHYIEVINFLKSANVSIGDDEIENAAIVSILYKLINKMQNRVIGSSNRDISFSISITEAWALRKVFRHAQPSGEVMIYIYPIVEKIEKFSQYYILG